MRRESYHFEARIVEFFPSSTPPLLHNNLNQDLYILRSMHVGGRILIVNLPILLGHLGMSPTASQNPGGRRQGGVLLPGRSESSVPALPGPLVGENGGNPLQFSNTFLGTLLCSSLQILHSFFPLFPWRTPSVNLHFSDLEVKRRYCYLCARSTHMSMERE